MSHVIALYADEDELARNEWPYRAFKFGSDGRWEVEGGHHPSLAEIGDVFAEIEEWHNELDAAERLLRLRGAVTADAPKDVTP